MFVITHMVFNVFSHHVGDCLCGLCCFRDLVFGFVVFVIRLHELGFID